MLKYKLSQEAYEEYKLFYGDDTIPFDLAEKKLNRNILCGKFVHEYNLIKKYHYKNMIIKTAFGEIIKVHRTNYVRKYRAKTKWKYNKLLGIV